MAKVQSTFPTTIDGTLQVDRAAGDVITSDSYDTIEDALFELETKVGVDTSAVATTLDYKLTNVASKDPGHLHTGSTASGSYVIPEPLKPTNMYATTKVGATIVSATNIYAATITGTTINATTVTGTNLYASTMTSTNIYASTITGSTIGATTITGTTVTGTNLYASTMTSTNIYAATITGSTIGATTITGTTVTGTNLYASTMTATTINATTVTGTNLYATTLTSTTVYGDTISGDVKTIVFDIPGTAEIGTFITTSFIVPFACTITKAYLYQRTASTGTTTLTVDIHKTGTSIWSGDQTKRLSATTAVVSAVQTSFTTTALVETDRLDIDFDAVGTTVAAANVTVELKVVT